MVFVVVVIVAAAVAAAVCVSVRRTAQSIVGRMWWRRVGDRPVIVPWRLVLIPARCMWARWPWEGKAG